MNNPAMIYVLVFAILLMALLLYFRIATRFRIIDKPNERSSHTRPVIRGAGIIFVIAVWCWYFLFDFGSPWFVVGITLVSIISFLDDVMTLPSGLRFVVHLLAVLLLFYQLDIFSWPVVLVVAAGIICIGTLNAFNFMDGINGITGVYALVTLLTFSYVHVYVVPFTNPDLVFISIIATLIFLFFNFRKKARCFAGDVGSVTLAFLQIFLLLQLMRATGEFGWALFFLVFGVDSVVTIIYRLRRKENIFKAHRTHLYQYLANEMKISHTTVSVCYGTVQLIVNVLVIRYFQSLDLSAVGFVLIYAFAYIFVRTMVNKRIALQNTR